MWRRFIYEYGNGRRETGAPALATGGNGKDGKNGVDAITLKIESSRGTVFKNNAVSTVLSAVIYKGSKRIANSTELKTAFGSSAYLQWKGQKLNEDTYTAIPSNDSRFREDCFKFVLSPDDVDSKTSFMCDLMN